MTKTVQDAMAGKTDGDSNNASDYGPTAPWWAKLVGSQGAANVILLLIAAAIIPVSVSWIRSAANEHRAVADAAIAQTEIHRHIDESIATQTTNTAAQAANLAQIVVLQGQVVDLQRQLNGKTDKLLDKQGVIDKLDVCLEKLIDRLDHPHAQDSAPACKAPPAPAPPAPK